MGRHDQDHVTNIHPLIAHHRRPANALANPAHNAAQHIDKVVGAGNAVAVPGHTAAAAHRVAVPVHNDAVKHGRCVAGLDDLFQTVHLASGRGVTHDHITADVLQNDFGRKAHIPFALISDRRPIKAPARVGLAVLHRFHDVTGWPTATIAPEAGHGEFVRAKFPGVRICARIAEMASARRAVGDGRANKGQVLESLGIFVADFPADPVEKRQARSEMQAHQLISTAVEVVECTERRRVGAHR